MVDDRSHRAASSREIWLTTADGIRLEAEVAVPLDPSGAVVLAHPHPLYGGSMRSIVTSELFRTLPEAGMAALRFNFRGVERSDGGHGGGIDERLDVEAALDELVDQLDHVGIGIGTSLPLVLCGWSFGGDVSLTVLDDRLNGWFLIAPTLRVLPADAYVVGHDDRPKLLAVPEHDEFRPPDSARAATSGWSNTRIEVVAGADHFLVGRTAMAHDLLCSFADELRS